MSRKGKQEIDRIVECTPAKSGDKYQQIQNKQRRQKAQSAVSDEAADSGQSPTGKVTFGVIKHKKVVT